jgi:proteasome accessory factor C
VRPVELREVFMAYYLADLVELGSFGQPVVEFFAPGADVEEVDPATAQWVRVVARDPEQELGVDHLRAEQLGRLFEAGADLLALEPDNETLRSALDAFQAALWPVDGPAGSQWKASTAQVLHRSVEQRRRVRITYVRQWHPGVRERVIEPYRLVRTRRGWEVDAGPADEVAAVRTYLVSGIQTCEVLDETFEPPADLDALLSAQREPVTVELVVPQERRWAVDRYAESVTVLADDEESVSVRAQLLPPVEQRLGLVLLTCGPEAFVVAPRALENAGVDLARRLLDHHRGATP